MQRVLEVMSAVPVLIIILSFVAVFGANIFNTMIILGLLSWESLARLVRGQTLQVRAQDFVMAAQSVGATSRLIMFTHVLPNVLPFVIVWLTFAFTGVILTETALSYLGLGVQLPLASWGNLVGAAGNLRDMQQRPWVWLPAGLMITLTVLSLNFIGDALRDAFDTLYSIDCIAVIEATTIEIAAIKITRYIKRNPPSWVEYLVAVGRLCNSCSDFSRQTREKPL